MLISVDFTFYKKVHSGTPACSTTKTGRHDIAEILLKVTLSTINQNQISIKVSSLILKIPPPIIGHCDVKHMMLPIKKINKDPDRHVH
jgi:hypothetical protein